MIVPQKGKGSSDEEESNVRESGVLVVKQQQQQQQQQGPPGALVRWERFLPVESLKVLLVENDDSTRHVVSALLRNCSYEVTATENGLEAWKILERLTNHVDLVLTEVAMPYLSGIGLLSKIMSHKTFKNIPVIMMSSHDSMGMIFNCLSKGAVDFLVKPIRKNELKNLWQHVWRRHRSSIGSGSESDIQTQKSVNRKSVGKDNDTVSNSEDDSRSAGLYISDGSDYGSRTQSSWTKQATEPESPQSMTTTGQLAIPPSSTCAQVIQSKAASCNEWVHMAGGVCNQEKEFLVYERVHKDSKLQDGHYPNLKNEKNFLSMSQSLEGKIFDNQKENKQTTHELHGSKASNELNSEMADLRVFVNPSIPQNLGGSDSNNTHVMFKSKDKVSDVSQESPSLELSLKRLISSKDEETGTTDDRNVLRHSNLSAFSRYTGTAVSNQIPSHCGGRCSFPLQASSGGMKIKSTCNHISSSNTVSPNVPSNDSCNNNNKGSTINNTFGMTITQVETQTGTSAVKDAYSSDYHPVKHLHLATQFMQKKPNNLPTHPTTIPPSDSHSQVKVHHYYHYHRHHQVYNMHQKQLKLQNSAEEEYFTLNMMSASIPVECDAANYSVNGSASGSNHGSNFHNDGSAAAITGTLHLDSDPVLAAKSGDGSGSGSVSGSGIHENRFAQREAALTKFRQKRKERCFEKKVRYQSRKRLAEQRPRVHGQFVRQAVLEPDKDVDADPC